MKFYQKFSKCLNDVLKQGAKVYVYFDGESEPCKTAKEVRDLVENLEECSVYVVMPDGKKASIFMVDQEPNDWGKTAELLFADYLNCDFE